MSGPASEPPRLRVEPFTAEGAPPEWTVRWKITNVTPRALHMESVVLPHTQFRSDERRLDRNLDAGASTEIIIPVRFGEPVGSVVENPFLIVRFKEGGRRWLALARVRVRAAEGGKPIADGEVVLTVNPGQPDR